MKTLMGGAMMAVLVGCAAHGPQSLEQSRASSGGHGIDEAEIAALFDRWNESLQTGDPAAVAENYADDSILLPTLSNQPRLTDAERKDYFEHFLQDGPSGSIDLRHISVDGKTAVDAGLYTFTFARTGETAVARYTFTYRLEGDEWLITSHHSSLLPE